MKKVTGEMVCPYVVNGFRFVWPSKDIGRDDVLMMVEYDYVDGVVNFHVWVQVGDFPCRSYVLSGNVNCEDDEKTIFHCIMSILNVDRTCRKSVLEFIDWVAEEERLS